MAAKKSVSKKSSASKSKKKAVARKTAGEALKIEKVLVENFVALQKIMTDLSANFEILNKKLTNLLNLFEDSAKALVKKDFDFGKTDDEELFKKLDEIMDQNKLIARGLTLMHDANMNKSSFEGGAASSMMPIQGGQKKAKVIEGDGMVESLGGNSVEEEPSFDIPKVPKAPEVNAVNNSGIPKTPTIPSFPGSTPLPDKKKNEFE